MSVDDAKNGSEKIYANLAQAWLSALELTLDDTRYWVYASPFKSALPEL